MGFPGFVLFLKPLFFRMKACVQLAAPVMALDGETDQFIQQVAIAHAGGLPHFGIHADAGETGVGVDFIELETAGFPAEKKINPGHAVALQDFKDLDSGLADGFR